MGRERGQICLIQEYATNRWGKGKEKGELRAERDPVGELERMGWEQMDIEQKKTGRMRTEDGGK